MRVVIIGGSSLIGQILFKELKKRKFNVIGTYNKSKIKDFVKFNIQKDDIDKKIDIKKDDVFFMLSAISNPNDVFKDKKYSNDININSTKKIIRKINSKGAKIFFFSSIEVFDGKKENYTERSKPMPLNLYGKQKYQIEKFLISKFKNFTIIRTSFIVGYKPTDRCPIKLTYDTIIKPKAKMADDNIFAITCVYDLVNLILIVLKSKKLFSKNILHLASPKMIIRFSLASKIKYFSKQKNKMKFKKVKFKEIKFLEKRGRKNSLASIYKEINNYKFRKLNKIIKEKTMILDKGYK
jgi:dTDP-4-dehydrorhamnose reductase